VKPLGSIQQALSPPLGISYEDSEPHLHPRPNHVQDKVKVGAKVGARVMDKVKDMDMDTFRVMVRVMGGVMVRFMGSL
jgi:hypothetical protein